MDNPENLPDPKTPAEEPPAANPRIPVSIHSRLGKLILNREFQEWLKFAVGFFGWYLASGIAWSQYSAPPAAADDRQGYGVLMNMAFFSLLYLAIAVVLLLVFAVTPSTRSIAKGLLLALALNFFISLLLGLTTNANCFIPFFIK